MSRCALEDCKTAAGSYGAAVAVDTGEAAAAVAAAACSAALVAAMTDGAWIVRGRWQRSS